MTCGERLRYIRLQKGLTQNKFAASINISRSSLIELESGKYYPSYQKLVNLIEEQNIDPLWLLTGEGHYQIEHIDEPRKISKRQSIQSEWDDKNLFIAFLRELQTLISKYLKDDKK